MFVEGPDRGYSWVIMFCCSYMHFALFGLFRCSGVLYVAVLKTYDVTREEASWPFSLCSAVFQLIGPAVSIMTHYVSKRATCLLGCVVATVGVVGCYFAENVMSITIFYGVIHGLGFGIVVVLIPVFINEYFVKHRATALGIAFSGGPISSFIIPIMMEWLLDNYNLKGSFLLLGGLVMNTIVAAALLRPPPWLRKSKNNAKLLDDSEAKDSGVSTSGGILNEKSQTIPISFLPIESESNELDDSVFIKNNSQDNDNESSIVDISAAISQTDPSTAEEDISEKQDTLVSNNDSMLFGGSVSKIYGVNDLGNYKNNTKSDCEIETPLMEGNKVYIVPKTTPSQNKGSKFKCKALYSVIEILKNPMFYLITSTMFIYFIALQSFFIVIVDYAKDKGIPESEGVYLMSIFSITDLVGRSGLGWVTDRNYVKRKNMVIINLIVIGVISQLYPLINDLTGLLVVAAFHGITAGCCISLFFVIQAEYFGMKRLTLIVGLTSFINGALTLLRPAIIGLFRDTIGSYDWMFHFFGIISLAFAFIWLIECWKTRDKICPTQNLTDKA